MWQSVTQNPIFRFFRQFVEQFSFVSFLIVLNVVRYPFSDSVPVTIQTLLLVLLPLTFHSDLLTNLFSPKSKANRLRRFLVVATLAGLVSFATVHWLAGLEGVLICLAYVLVPFALPAYFYKRKGFKFGYLTRAIWVRWLKSLLIVCTAFPISLIVANAFKINPWTIFYLTAAIISPIYFLSGFKNGIDKIPKTGPFKWGWVGLTLGLFVLFWMYTGYPWPYYQNNYYLAKFANQLTQFKLPSKTQFVGKPYQDYGNVVFKKMGDFFAAQLIFSELSLEELNTYFKNQELKTAYNESPVSPENTYLIVVPIHGFRSAETRGDTESLNGWWLKDLVVTYEQFGLDRQSVESLQNGNGSFYALVAVDGPYAPNDIRSR